MKEAGKTRKRRYCDIVKWKTRKRSCRRTSPGLPHEVIENILSRLTVKELLRLRVVCKQWEATISDPTFAQIYLQQSKNPSSQNLIAWENLCGFGGFNGLHVAELRNNCIELVRTIEHSREYGLRFFITTMCSCDGLYLMCLRSHLTGRPTGRPVKSVLWNPSRRTYRKFYFPHSIKWNCCTRIRGMYYDPLKKDYKIVIADLEHYAVYSCRDNKWGDVKEMKGFSGDHCPDNNVSVNGSIYWLLVDFLGPEAPSDDPEGKEVFRYIICFDCKDETFKRLPLPNCENREEKFFQLTSLGGQLCLLIRDWEFNRIEIMRKVSSSDEWMESKEDCLCECKPEMHPDPVCQVSENKILLHAFMDGRLVYVLYDKSKNTLVEILNPPSKTIPPISKHVENLLLL